MAKTVPVEKLVETYNSLYQMKRIMVARQEPALLAKTEAAMNRIARTLEPFVQELDEGG